MNIIIIEDELKTARSLEKMILDLRPDARVVARLQSIERSIEYFSKEGVADLLFMDIQLSDGISFEIFKSVTISCPIIFCTAYDDYSLEAFKTGGIDYVLKPFSQSDIQAALKKAEDLKNFFQKATVPDFTELLSRLSNAPGKQNFLVIKNHKYLNIPTESIAYFYVKYEASFIRCFDEQEYNVNTSLDQIVTQLSADQFFRLNRQYLVNFKAIKEVEHYFQRKLLVKLTIPTPEKLLINKEKSTAFLKWLENR